MPDGGRFRFVGEHIKELLEEIGSEGAVEDRWPFLAEVLKSVGEWVEITERTLTKELDGKTSISITDREFDLAAVGALIDRVLKLMPEDVYPLKKESIARWKTMTGCEMAASYVGDKYPNDVWADVE